MKMQFIVVSFLLLLGPVHQTSAFPNDNLIHTTDEHLIPVAKSLIHEVGKSVLLTAGVRLIHPADAVLIQSATPCSVRSCRFDSHGGGHVNSPCQFRIGSDYNAAR